MSIKEEQNLNALICCLFTKSSNHQKTQKGGAKIPLIQVKLIEGVFSQAQKQETIKKLTDIMVSIEGDFIDGDDRSAPVRAGESGSPDGKGGDKRRRELRNSARSQLFQDSQLFIDFLFRKEEKP